MIHATALRTFALGVAISFACVTATAADVSHRESLGITPTSISIPLPVGDLSARVATGISAAVLPAVVGDIFGMPPVSSNWDSVRAAVAAGGFATRPTVGVDD
ncbi:hypothetical protein EBU58_07175 [bacterium]|nr:hypothetical protein [bacterium]